MEEQNPPEQRSSADRLEAITQREQAMRPGLSRVHSRFIRMMKLFLPVLALGIIAVLFIVTGTDQDSAQIVERTQQETAQPAFGQNELINPRFESMDDKRQPYTITAARAIQGEEQDNLILLEQPLADMLLNNGRWVAIESLKGAYRQDTGRLLLSGQVKIYHDAGYQILTEELNVDLESATALSQTAIAAQGPAGTLEATGVQADNIAGKVVFNGPIKLVIKQALKL